MVSSSSNASSLSKRELRNRRILFKRLTKKPNKNRENTSFNVEGQTRKSKGDITGSNHDNMDFVAQNEIGRSATGLLDVVSPSHVHYQLDDNDHQEQKENQVQGYQEQREHMDYQSNEGELEERGRNSEIRDNNLNNDATNGHDIHHDDEDGGAIDYRHKQKKKEKKDSKRYNDLKKDMAAINARIDPLIKEWKEIKAIIKRRSLFTPEVTDDDDDEEYDELPRLPLKKIKHLLLMQDNIRDNRVYKKQLIAKLRSIGGSDIKKNVINIFNKLLSLNLRKKICWKGSLKGNKTAFKDFENILGVLRQAVKYRHKKCSADNIATECKLRFKQAQKDHDRAVLKQQ